MNIKTFSKLTMIEQSLFGLPWTLTGALLPFFYENKGERLPFSYLYSWSLCLSILLAFFSARILGMSFNRLLDKKIDAENPRTKNRVLPSGEASEFQVWVLVVLSTASFVFACFCINRGCLLLSPVILSLLWGYSYTKRFTMFCHFVLGVIQFFGPFCAWVAITGDWAVPPIYLGLAVLFAIAGMDILYAFQEIGFDQENGIFSVPARLGMDRAYSVAKCCHALVVALLLNVAFQLNMPLVFYSGIGVIAVLFLYFYQMISPKNLENIPRAFFQCNAFVAMALFFSTVGAILCEIL